MSENTAPEPSQDEVEELIEDLEGHEFVPSGITEDCTNSCICSIAC